jgi:hypothetical protein
MMQDPGSGLLMPKQFVDQKQALKKTIDDLVDSTVLSNQHIRETYYLTLHMKFDKNFGNEFHISRPVISKKLPPFVTNQFVFWVNNSKGICELLWMTSKRNGKLAIDFNKEGVAYLQAKGAMPT